VDLKRWLRAQWDRVGAWVLIGGGALFLLLGWIGASNTPFPAEQIPFVLSGGVGGALLVGLGAALLISADLRDEWHKLDRIERAIRERPDPEPDGVTDANGSSRPTRRSAARASKS